MSVHPKIFLSHSHRDRHSATELQVVLETHGAKTYLDQDRIQAGDILPERIREGISWCDIFLLIWSSNAAVSDWVGKEWNTAYDLGKKVIPYSLDSAPLPDALQSLIRVEADDRERADAKLLMAVFGRDFTPDATTLFPGNWHASVDAFGMAQGTYDLELRPNGQVEGNGGISNSGVAGQIADQMGMGGLLSMRIPFHGSWSYDRGSKTLTIETSTGVVFGQQQNDTIRIRTTGHEKGAITGRDLAGRIWTLWRVDVLGDVSPRVPSTTRSKERETTRAPSDAYAVRPSQEEVNKMAELYESWHAAQGEEDLTLLTELLIREAVNKHLKTLGKSGREADEADFEEVIAMARQVGLLR